MGAIGSRSANPFGAAIDLDEISVDLATQAELNAHTGTDINTAHPGTLDDGNLTETYVQDAGSAPQIAAGTKANRPAADGSQGIYYATDEQITYYDDGGAWEEIGRAAAQILAADLGFDPYTQSEGDAHAATDINTAHPGTPADADKVDGEHAADIVTKARVDAVGADADTVDGEHASAFADANHNHDGTYLGTFTERASAEHTPASSSTWEDWDISGEVSAGAQVALIACVVEVDGNRTVGVRKNGSTLDRTILMRRDDTMVLPVDVSSSKTVEIFHSTSDTTNDAAFYVVGEYS